MIQTPNQNQGLCHSSTLGRRAACMLENRNSEDSEPAAPAVLLLGLWLNITHASTFLCTFRIRPHWQSGRDPRQGQMQKELESVACSGLQQAGNTISDLSKMTPAVAVSTEKWHLAMNYSSSPEIHLQQPQQGKAVLQKH